MPPASTLTKRALTKKASAASSAKKRVRANRLPLGDLTPTVKHAAMLSKAHELRDLMPECRLDDLAISLVALRVNTGAPTAKIAQLLGMRPETAYITLGRPQAQDLMAQLAKSMLGEAALAGLHTMLKIMSGPDPALAYRAADTMMERAGLGLSQRSTPDGSTKTVFQFAFGAPQAAASPSRTPSGEAPDADGMGPISVSPQAKDLSKTPALPAGEALPPVILEPLPPDSGQSPQPLASGPEKRIKREPLFCPSPVA